MSSSASRHPFWSRHPFSPRHPLASVLAAGVSLALACGAALVITVISAAPASAHAVLVKITPGAGAQLTAAPTQVVVEFDEPVSTAFATVLVTNAAGVPVANGKATVLGAKVTQALSPDLVSGTYRIAFQVTSVDGHPVSGESKFTVKVASGPGSTTPTGAPSPTPTASVTASAAGVVKTDDGSSLSRFLVPIGGAVGLLVIGAGVLVWERQRD